MDKKSVPFSPAAPLFVAYYLLFPIFLAVMGQPFIGSLFSASTLFCLGLGVVMLLKKPKLPVAVFTLVGAFLQVSPLIYYLSLLFKGSFDFSTFACILRPLFSAAALLFITLFAILLAFKDAKLCLNRKLWFLPAVFEGASLLLMVADLLWKASLAAETNLLPLILNLVLMLIYSAAIVLTAFWYKKQV